jgi:hypothetical protein
MLSGHIAQLQPGASCLRVNAVTCKKMYDGFTRVSVPISNAGTIHVSSGIFDVPGCLLSNLLKYQRTNDDRKRSMRVGSRTDELKLR